MISVYMDDQRTPMSKANRNVPDPYWVVVRTIKDTKELLTLGIVHDLALDHDMGLGDTGYDLAKWMEANNVWPTGKITLHSANIVGRDNMRAVLNRNGR